MCMECNYMSNVNEKSLFPNKFFSGFTFALIIIINVILESIQIFYHEFSHIGIILTNIQLILFMYLSYKYLTKGFFITLLFGVVGFVYNLVQFFIANDLHCLELVSLWVVSILLSGLIFSLSVRQRNYTQNLEQKAFIDCLTQTFNHRFFQEFMDKEFIRAIHNKNTIGLIKVGIDNFKRFNDVFGHDCGDNLLIETSKILKSAVRVKDIVCRYSGDEFMIIVPNTNLNDLLKVSSTIKSAYGNMVGMCEKSRGSNISISLGYSIYPNLASNKDELIMQVDNALYHAKQSGKDNIKMFRDIYNDIKQLIQSSEDDLLVELKSILAKVSEKDLYTLGHSERVVEYAVAIGKAMDLKTENLRALSISALLHDVGKIEIPREVLIKKERLTDEEYAIMKMHPIYSVEIINQIPNFERVREIVRHHHERIDGLGYPDRIQGDEIPIEARILTVADSFDAMMSNRPYRRSLSLEEAIKELKACTGKQFDPQVTDVFIQLLDKEIIV